MVTRRTYRKKGKDPGPTRSILYNTRGKRKTVTLNKILDNKKRRIIMAT